MKTKIDKIVFGGKGLSKFDDKVCFVPYTLPDEVVEIKVVEEKKNICEGFPVEILHKNPNRVTPECKYYMECGGCDFQHATYSYQLELKKQVLEETFQRIGKLSKTVDKVIPSKSSFYYRNRVQLKVKNGNLGFYKFKSNELVSIDECKITSQEINSLIPILKNIVSQYPFITEIHVFYPEGNKPTLKIFLDRYEELDLSSIDHIFNGIGLYWQNKRKKILGKNFTFQKVKNFNYRVSLDSFFQVNKYQLENIVEEVLNEIDLNVSVIGDIFCGVGLFTIPLSKKAKKVFGVESNKSSVKDALYNAKINNTPHIKFYEKAAEKSLDVIFGYNPEILIFDPPRTGIPKNILRELGKIKSLKKIVYVSCNPSTAARDINIISQNFKLEKLKLIDMFPQTHHIESISVLTRI